MAEKKSKLVEIKTKPTGASIESFIENISTEPKRNDSLELLNIMKKISGEEPKLWGSSIIGFGDKRFKSQTTGREVDWFVIGFSPRKANLSLYLNISLKEQEETLKKLGKHKTGAGCIYINKLSDIDIKVLKEMIKTSLKKNKQYFNNNSMQSTNHILLVRPSEFIFNDETSSSNTFQNNIETSKADVKQSALREFENFAATLKTKGIDVIIIDDTKYPQKPDAIFPNNWITFHSDGTVVLYPMMAKNRRIERRKDILDFLSNYFEIKKIIDLSKYELENKFLEGTGSIVFDHIHKIAYACLSPRTNKEIFDELCEILHYKPISFKAFDENDNAIYHTNVMMCITEDFAVVCLESIKDIAERKFLISTIANTGKIIIEISHQQMNSFAGNMLSIKTETDKRLLILSRTAYDSLNQLQIETMKKHYELVPISISTIETIGGGSVRCMMAEIFLSQKH